MLNKLASPFSYRALVVSDHSEVDQTWARWLSRSLKDFVVPESFTLIGYPACLGDVLLDCEEFVQADDVLSTCEYLLVVLSASSISSQKIKNYIQYFTERALHERIILFITDDEAQQASKDFCDCRLLDNSVPDQYQHTPLVIDVRDRDFHSFNTVVQSALLNIVAKFIKIPYFRLKDKYLGIKKTSSYQEYYSHLTFIWGEIRGQGLLSQSQLQHRKFAYHVDVVGGKVVKICRRNDSGDLSPDLANHGAVIWLITYRLNKVHAIEIYGLNNRLVRRDLYRDANNIDMHWVSSFEYKLNVKFLHKYREDIETAYYLNRYAYKVVNKYNEFGFTYEREYFIDESRSTLKTSTVIEKSQLNNLGLVLKRQLFDHNGKRIIWPCGIDIIEHQYDGFGQHMHSKFGNGDKDSASIVTAWCVDPMRDAWGNIIRNNVSELTAIKALPNKVSQQDEPDEEIKSLPIPMPAEKVKTHFLIAWFRAIWGAKT